MTCTHAAFQDVILMKLFSRVCKILSFAVIVLVSLLPLLHRIRSSFAVYLFIRKMYQNVLCRWWRQKTLRRCTKRGSLPVA